MGMEKKQRDKRVHHIEMGDKTQELRDVLNALFWGFFSLLLDPPPIVADGCSSLSLVHARGFFL